MSERTYGSITFETSNEDKVLYPGDGLTKGDVIDYYERVAEVMLPHLEGRPISMHRFPDGIEGEGFFQKDVPDYFPDWIESVEVEKEGGALRQVLCSNEATLAYLGQQACLTPHVWLSRVGALDRPDLMVFDLDPAGDEPDVELLRFAASRVRELLEEIGLCPFVKSTGSRGLHVTVPLDPSASFDASRGFARDLADLLGDRHPERLTTAQRKAKRGTRLYLDTGRNARAQTAVAPYALRARPGAPVAAPLDWSELDASFHPRRIRMENLFRRLSQKEDPWKGMHRHARSLEGPRRALDRLLAS